MLAINNLSAKLATQRDSILQAVTRVLDSGWLVLGPEVGEFEKAFAAYVGATHCVGVANGTDAIELALRAVGVKAGDRVVTVANAGMYGTTAIRAIGAHPVFADVDPESMHITLADVENALRSGARALILTHLYGRAVADTGAIAAACAARKTALIEDCAQAHGARIAGRGVGTFGDAAAFSFYPTKNLGALGDGGAVVSLDGQIAARVVQLRQYGWKEKYRAELSGARNSRLDEIQAAVLSALLPNLDAANERRRAIAARYASAIQHPKIRVPRRGGSEDVVHLFVVRTEQRDALRIWLREHGVGSDIHYPIPDHLQAVMNLDKELECKLPITERHAAEILTLPCFPEMHDREIEHVIHSLNSWPQ